MGCQQNLAQMIIDQANAQGVPVDLAMAVAQRESNTCHWLANGQIKVSSAGAIGVMQLMPATAAQLGVNPYDVNQNIQGGVAYLAQLFQQFGDWNTTLEAYNWGPGKVSMALTAGTAIPGSVVSYAAAIAGQVGYGSANGSNNEAEAQPTPAAGSGLIWAAAGAAALAIALAA